MAWYSNTYNNSKATTGTPYGNISLYSNVAGSELLKTAVNKGTDLLGAISGVPQVSQAGGSLLNGINGIPLERQYVSTQHSELKGIPGIQYPDFRARMGNSRIENIVTKRLDGASSASDIAKKNGRWISVAYAAASATPAGVYSLFNREADAPYGFGWGDHGNPAALRTDFTARSHVSTYWNSNTKKWRAVRAFDNPLAVATPFRGDKVSVIDFKRDVSYDEIYKWRDTELEILGLDLSNIASINETQDFIKFFFTSPSLPRKKGDAIVFRASITSLTDSFNPSITPQMMVGRADPNYHYTGYSRNLQITFDVYATDRDEMKPIWRKLNALAGYTAPTYNKNSIAMEAPWFRITIGDLFVDTPALINSLTYTLHDTTTTWEINIEKDSSMMQAPKYVSVTLGLDIITEDIPQKDGKFYHLTDKSSVNRNKPGNDNWLSDFKTNDDVISDISTETQQDTNGLSAAEVENIMNLTQELDNE